MNTENVDCILDTEITARQLEAARKFLNSNGFQFTTTALYALSMAVREQYEEAEKEEAPCADLLKQFACGSFVQAEAEEV